MVHKLGRADGVPSGRRMAPCLAASSVPPKKPFPIVQKLRDAVRIEPCVQACMMGGMVTHAPGLAGPGLC